MKVIGFSGKAQHGKDTCAEIFRQIASSHGIGMGSWALAHPLKAQVFGEAGGEFAFDEVWFNKPPAVRKQLQLRGTEQGRDVYGLELWTLQSEAYINLFRDHFPLDGLTFTDIRFPNEVDFVKLGGVVKSVYFQRRYVHEMRERGFGEYLDQDPENNNTMMELLRTEMDVVDVIMGEFKLLSANGMALYIQSDRPTLTGEAALHPSETALDQYDKSNFDGIIDNSLGVTFEDLREQLTPYVEKLFNL